MTALAFAPPRQPWREHYTQLRSTWEQGEHVLLVGPTSAGKTTLMHEIIYVRRHVVVFVSKFKDPAFVKLFRGWRIVREWKEVRRGDEKVLLWPKAKGDLRERAALHRDVFKRALNAIGTSQGWTVVIDEMAWMTDPQFCNLGAEIKILHHQGRTQGITMVDLTQRPSWIPKIVYSSISHAYIARTYDADDVKRLSDLGGQDSKGLAMTVMTLPDRHDYVYLNPQGSGQTVVVNVRQ